MDDLSSFLEIFILGQIWGRVAESAALVCPAEGGRDRSPFPWVLRCQPRDRGPQRILIRRSLRAFAERLAHVFPVVFAKVGVPLRCAPVFVAEQNAQLVERDPLGLD